MITNSYHQPYSGANSPQGTQYGYTEYAYVTADQPVNHNYLTQQMHLQLQQQQQALLAMHRQHTMQMQNPTFANMVASQVRIA